MTRRLDRTEIDAALEELPGWQGDAETLRREYAFATFPMAIEAVVSVAVEAEGMDHHPDIDIRWRRVLFVLATHSAGGVTQLDVELAHRIAAVATRLEADGASLH